MKKRKSTILIAVIIAIVLIISSTVFVMAYNASRPPIKDTYNPPLIEGAKEFANHYNLHKSNDKISVFLDSAIFMNETMYFWIRVDGIPDNKIYDNLKECTVIDENSGNFLYWVQEDSENFGVSKQICRVDGQKINELIIKFTAGMETDSIISINFDFGEFGEIAFNDINAELLKTAVYKFDNNEIDGFDLPYAHCEILKVEYSPLGVFFTIRWELQEGFTESTKNEYWKYHTKFTYGNNSRYTFLLLPDHWSSDESVVISTYHLEEIISDGESIIIDLYLNDDTTFERNLTSVKVNYIDK